MCYIELKNEKYETLEDLKRLLHYILRLDKTAEDSQRANTITNTLAGCQPAMIPNEYLCDPSSVYVLISDIVKAMPKVSCATLETVMNLAALNSVYQGHEHIQKEDITEALLQVVYKLQKTDKETDSAELQKIAVHEAAHAVVGEVLHPGSIGIVTVRGSQGVIGGMANGCATYAQNEEEFLDEVTKTLAGRAGVSLIYGVMDIQASADIEQADKLMDIWLCHFAGGGFVGIESGDNRMSEQRLSYNEAIKSAKLEELYRRAYKILHNNKYFLLAVQHGLLEHETLLNSDLAKIRGSFPNFV